MRLLRHLGAEVVVPSGQTCCGQPAFNSGHRSEARRMAEHTLSVLGDADYVVLPSGSCAGMIRCFYPRIVPGPLADRVADRTYELAHFVVRVLGRDSIGGGLLGHRVAYHHGCHALRELGVEEEPIRLLESAGAEVVPWEADRECCGFGGLFSAKLPEVSAAMADTKLASLPAVDVVTSADGGCLLQLSGRSARVVRQAARRSRATTVPRAKAPPRPRFRHLASVLWQAVEA